MIRKGNGQTAAVHYGTRAIAAVYRGARLVWTAIRSCFGSGVWLGDKNWINDENWK
nr:MAG TPA: hypothetical protein [Bacteriophage sp.]DAX57362.1 MAG TPA: hypothetical protein [Bacteriophage sp.]